MTTRLLLLGATTLLLASGQRPTLEASRANTQRRAAAPLSLDGTLRGAPYSIRVPMNWNGTLLVYAHGYRVRSNRPDQPDDRRAFPAVTPREGFPQLPEMEEVLLARGYALAGSAYRANGFAVEEAIADTRDLVRFFKRRVAEPARTLLYGVSMGALVALQGAERQTDLYDGAVCVCGTVAGTPLSLDRFLDFAAAYAVAFGWPDTWGAVGDVRDDLDFETEVVPQLLGRLQSPDNFGRFEFIRLVTRSPIAGFYDGTAPSPWLFLNMFFATEGLAELAQRAGGPPAQNVDHRYSLSDDERDYLLSLGVDPEPLLADLRATRFLPRVRARRYVERHYEASGRLRIPLVAIHTTTDGVSPAAHERVLRNIVRAAGRQRLLLQAYADSVGHCSFTEEQFLTAIEMVERWVHTGERPDPREFPASLGFVPGFKPPAWPRPARMRPPFFF